MRQVAGCSLSHEPGSLTGFSRRAVKGEKYPGIMPDRTGLVEGVIYFAVPHRAWARLDGFEGPMYERRLVEVQRRDGASIEAGAYVVRPEFLVYLEEYDWDFKEFLDQGKADFERSYRGFRTL